jgi:hypothetical protein
VTTAALIDTHLVNELEMSADETADAEQATIRAQVLSDAQEIADQFCNAFSDADFLQDEFSVNVSAGARTFPSDTTFETLGDLGGLWHSPDGTISPGIEVTYLTPHEFFKIRNDEPTASSGRAEFFTIYGISASNTPLFYFHPKAASNVTFVYRGRTLPPVLIDTTGATNGLDVIPAAYHSTIFLKGLRLLEAAKNGDGRTNAFDDWFEKAIRSVMARRRNGLQEEQRLSSAGGVWTYGAW